MWSESRFRRSRGSSGLAVWNRSDGVPSWSSLWDGLALFITAAMPATSDGMENNLIEVSTGWISECGWLSLMIAEQEFVLNAYVMFTGDSIPNLLSMMNFEKADELSCEWASNIWAVFWIGLGYPWADSSCLFQLSSNPFKNCCCNRLVCFKSKEPSVLLKTLWVFKVSCGADSPD